MNETQLRQLLGDAKFEEMARESVRLRAMGVPPDEIPQKLMETFKDTIRGFLGDISKIAAAPT